MMDQLSLAIFSVAGSLVVVTAGHFLTRWLNTRRENAIKWGEVRSRFAALRFDQKAEYTPEERAAFLKHYNDHSLWMLSVSGYLSERQKRDVQLLKSSLIPIPGHIPSPAEFKRWWQAEQYVFPNLEPKRRLRRARLWLKRQWKKYREGRGARLATAGLDARKI